MIPRALCCTVSLLLALPGCGPAREPERLDNLLLILLDTTRADHLSCYGYPKETTREIDNLGRGIRFEAAFAQSSLTPVSAATLLTGTHPWRHGVRSLFVVGEQSLAPEVPSLFETLRSSGFRTAGFVGAKPMGAQYGLARGFELYDDDLTETARRHALERFDDAPQRPADETVDRVLAWLDQHGRERFALLVHLFDAHDPSFVPPRELLEQHLSIAVPEGIGRTTTPESWPELYQPEHLVELYDAELSFMSDQVLRILIKLEELGSIRRTLTCVVGDHGEAFGEHGFWTHGILYEEQLRVPLILSGSVLPKHVSVPDTVRLVDVAPTLLEILGVDAAGAAFDGSSLMPFLRAPSQGRPERPREVYAEVRHAPEDRLRRPAELYSLRLGRWKLIHHPGDGRHELYDLEADPGELENLYTPEHAMGRVLSHRLLSLGSLGGELPSLEGISEEELARLRALGYL